MSRLWLSSSLRLELTHPFSESCTINQLATMEASQCFGSRSKNTVSDNHCIAASVQWHSSYGVTNSTTRYGRCLALQLYSVDHTMLTSNYIHTLIARHLG